MATESDNESEVSFATSSVVDEDVQWPSNSAARAADQLALDPGSQKEFEKFVKKKHDQVSPSLGLSGQLLTGLRFLPRGLDKKRPGKRPRSDLSGPRAARLRRGTPAEILLAVR